MPSASCRLAPLLWSSGLLLLSPGCGREPAGPNILLITLDTTRRDHLGCYGYELPTSPELDRLAADSVVYTNAYAVSSWTLPTHASMFTGKFPSSHGAQYDPEGPLQLTQGITGLYDHYRARPIAENEVTLAQLLADQGYETAGIIAGPWMKQVFRLGKGFEHYDDQGVTALNGRPAEDVTRAAISFVDEYADEPFFLFLNYYDPHGPWWEDPARDAQGRQTGPPTPFHDPRPVMPAGIDPSRMDRVTFARICYDAEIRHMDGEIGKLLEHLRQRGLYEGAWIFVLADHGELIADPVLGETGLTGHGDSLTQPEIHIPFLVKEPGPGGRKGEDARFVQQVDLLPTVLARLGLPPPPDIQGRALGDEHLVVSELTKLPIMNRSEGHNAKDWRHLGDWRVLVEGSHKFGWSSNGTHFLVDLESDPLERTNRYEVDPERARRMERALTEYLAGLPEPGVTGAVQAVDESTIRALDGLGYTGEDGTGAIQPGSPAGQVEEEREGSD